MIDCPRSELRDQLPALVSGTLAAAERAVLEAHVATCAACRDEVALLRTLRGALIAGTPKVDTARIAAAIRAKRVDHAPHAAPLTRRSLAWARRPLPAWAWRVAAAVLAVASIGLGYLIGFGRSEMAQLAVERRDTVASAPAVRPVSPPALAPPEPPPRVAVHPTRAPRIGTASATGGLSFGGGVAGLTDAQVNALVNDLDKMAPALDVEPEPVLDLGGAT